MTEKGEISHRLREFGKNNYPSMSAFAQALGMPPQALNNYLSGQTNVGGIIQNRLRELGCDIEWLMTGRTNENVMHGTKDEINDLHVETVPLVKIPVFEYAKPGGHAMVLRESPSSYIVTQKSTDKSLYAVKAKGDSMSPNINEGDIVVLSKKQKPNNGDICLAWFNNKEALIRKIYFHGSGITLAAINEKNYPPKDFKKSDIKHIHKAVQKITNY